MSSAARHLATGPRSVTVTTGSRLHFGLLTHRPESGREFGGLGVMIDAPGWQISTSTDSSTMSEAAASRSSTVSGDVRIAASEPALLACPDVEARVGRILSHWDQSNRDSGRSGICLTGLSLRIDKAIPGHRGLGSGTQFGLAIGRALSELAGESSVCVATLAERTGRGLRSAVGTWGFESGGLIVDGGKLPEQSVGTCVSRCDFPDAWRFLLIAPADGRGLSGADEVAAFEQLRGMPPERTERLCRIALMNLLPAIADADIGAASVALTEYGRVSGEYFSTVQGGVFADGRMAEIGRRVTLRGRGFFQTSWGPTCAALCASDEELADLRRELESADSGSLILTAARPLNHGASVTVSSAD
jgi:beta-ribofuranosylaminobenzene 5'-phosphate synthase